MPVLSRAAAILIVSAALNATSLRAAPAGGPLGLWLDDTSRGAVEIKPCGDKLCGYVVWVKNAADNKGCGRQIIGDAASSGRLIYTGWIYSPERGKRYNVELTPLSDGRLKVLGYAGTKLFSKTMYWKPAPVDLQRCIEAAKATPQTAAPEAPNTAQPADAPNQAHAAKAAQSQLSATSAAPPATTPTSPATPPPAKAAEAQPKPTSNAASAQAATAASPRAAAPVVGDTERDSAPALGSAQATDTREVGGTAPRRLARVLDQVLERSANGDCNLDLPWVKVKFKCGHN